MKAQFKYALRQGLALRATAFALVAALNIVFGVLGYFKVLNNAGMVTATTLSSIALCGIFVICIIADVESFKSMFAAPQGYLLALAPVKSWKIMLARMTCIICEDFIALFMAIFGIVWQSCVLDGVIGMGIDYSIGYESDASNVVFGIIAILLSYAYIMMMVAFGVSLQNSVLFGVRGRKLLTMLVVAGVAWGFNLLNFIVAPFGILDRWKLFFSIALPYGFSAGAVVYALLSIAKIAALFVAASSLMERKINL